MSGTDGAAAVLVTGGAGYIGSHVCLALAAAGFVPIAYDNLSAGHAGAVQWGPLVQADLDDAATLDRTLELYHPQAVVHMAGRLSTSESVVEPALYYRDNVVGTLALLDAMRRHGVNRIVFSSSAAVYGEPQVSSIPETHPLQPINPYGRSKLMIETCLSDYAAAYGMGSVSLRYFNAAGADPAGRIGEAHPVETHLVPLVLEAAAGLRPAVSVFGTDYPTRDGTCLRDYIHVCDLAAAHVAALSYLERRPGAHVFNLGSGEGATVREVIACAARVTGRPIPAIEVARRPGDPATLLADPAAARRLLGWKPQHAGLDNIMETAWNWLARRSQPAQLAERALS